MEPLDIIETAALFPSQPEQPLTSRRDSLLYIGLLAGVVAASQLSLFYTHTFGTYLNTLVLALLMALSTRVAGQKRALYTGAALIPLLSLVNLSIVHQSAFNQTAFLYGSMFILALIYRYIFRPVAGTMITEHVSGFYTVGVTGGLAAGAVLGAISYWLLQDAYIFGGSHLLLVFAVAAIGALAEEFLFRGLIQRSAMQIMRPVYAVLLTTILYGTLSFSHFSAWALPVGLLSAAILSTLYAKTHSLVLTITLNMTSKFVFLALVANYLFH